MAKCEVINLTRSDSDFIQSKPSVSVSSFCILHQVSVKQVSTTTEIIFYRIRACT